MTSRPRLFTSIGACALVIAFALPVLAQGQLSSPGDVKTGLRILNQVVGHTGRLIASKNYAWTRRPSSSLQAFHISSMV